MDDYAKQLMLKMANAIEHFYFESTATLAVLQSYGRSGWQQKRDQMLSDQAMKDRVHEIFQPLYENIDSATQDSVLAGVLERLLQTPKGEPN